MSTQTLIRCLSASLLVVAECLAAPGAHAARVNYAVVIGNNTPPASDPALMTLRHADDDAVRYYELFQRAGRAVVLLTVFDEATQRRYRTLAPYAMAPTLANVRKVLAHLQTSMARDLERGDTPVLFVTYSGHGTVEKGSPGLALLDEALTRDVLYREILASIPSSITVHLIVDACFAGAVVNVRGPFSREIEPTRASISDPERRLLIDERSLDRFPNVGAILASASYQEAYEWSRIESGVFTHEVLSGLLGAADANGDRSIEYSELEAFVAAANRSQRDPRAAPHLRTRAPVGSPHSVILSLDEIKNSVFLSGDPSKLGHFWVERANGQRWLEAHLNTKDVTLAVPRERGVVLRTEYREADVPTGARRPVPFQRLAFGPPEIGPRGPMDRARERDLFATAYGPDFYRGHVAATGRPEVDWKPAPARRLAVRPVEPASNTVPIVLAALSAATLATAAFAGYNALDAKSQFENETLEDRAYELNDAYQKWGTVAVMTGATGIAAGLGATAWWLWVSGSPEGQDRTQPGVGIEIAARW